VVICSAFVVFRDGGLSGGPSPLAFWGYFAHKLFYLFSLRGGTGRKILKIKDLLAKYSK
jgi:hypothetical protein